MIVFDDTETKFKPEQAEKPKVEAAEEPRKIPHIVPVASGKGGVGKTLFAVNMGIRFAAEGLKTVVVDLDVGSSNLHTYMGIKNKFPGIGEFLLRKGTDLSKYLLDTKYRNLEIIPGDQLIPDLADFSAAQRRKLIEGIKGIDADLVLLDLGAGAHASVTDFFLLSEKGLIVTVPTHGAILNAFSFLKTLVYRIFKLNFDNPRQRRLINEIKKCDDSGKFPTFWDILNHIAAEDKEAAVKFKEILAKFSPRIVFNMVEGKDDVTYLKDLVDLIYQKLIVEPEVLGYLPKLKIAHQSVKQRVPFVELYPDSSSAYSIGVMTEKIMMDLEKSEPLFDVSRYSSSFQEVEYELRGDKLFNAPPKAAVPAFKNKQQAMATAYQNMRRANNNPFDALRMANQQYFDNRVSSARNGY